MQTCSCTLVMITCTLCNCTKHIMRYSGVLYYTTKRAFTGSRYILKLDTFFSLLSTIACSIIHFWNCPLKLLTKGHGWQYSVYTIVMKIPLLILGACIVWALDTIIIRDMITSLMCTQDSYTATKVSCHLPTVMSVSTLTSINYEVQTFGTYCNSYMLQIFI